MTKKKPQAAQAQACRLYLITPPSLPNPWDWVPLFEQTLDAGDVACVQLRLKDVDDDTICRAVDVLRPLAQRRDVAFILNDRPDLAFETGCDGVHVGQDDMPYRAAREAVGPDALVGVTCHGSRHLAMEAGDQGADYVAFGAFFPTTTKDPKDTDVSLELIEWWHDIITVPCVAIGGITVENCPPLVTAGADFLAVCGGVWNHPEGPVEAVRAFNRIIAASQG